MEPTQTLGAVVSGSRLVTDAWRERRRRPPVYTEVDYPQHHDTADGLDHIRIRIVATAPVYIDSIGIVPGSRWRRAWWTITGRSPWSRLTTRSGAPTGSTAPDSAQRVDRGLPNAVTVDTPLTVVSRLPCPLPPGIRRGTRTAVWLRVNGRRYRFGVITIPQAGGTLDHLDRLANRR